MNLINAGVLETKFNTSNFLHHERSKLRLSGFCYILAYNLNSNNQFPSSIIYVRLGQ